MASFDLLKSQKLIIPVNKKGKISLALNFRKNIFNSSFYNKTGIKQQALDTIFFFKQRHRNMFHMTHMI